LSDFLPKKPSEVELKVMKEMFEASVDGEPYDMERWGQYFKPAGMSQNTGDPQKPASTPKAAPAPSHDDEDDTPAPVAKATPAPAPAAEASGGGDSRAQDILAMIRNRQK
jgi:septal ring-binding cell division protein DamX